MTLRGSRFFVLTLGSLAILGGSIACLRGVDDRAAVAAVEQQMQAAVAQPDPIEPEEEAGEDSEQSTPSPHPLISAAMTYSAFVPTAALPSEIDEARLAEEMGRRWTRDSRQLVSVIGDALREDNNSLPLTFLLAIAHAETNGRVLLVSEAGAAGLAQATPAAFLSEGFDGKLFVTNDYLVGTRAYILKKPLKDIEKIAAMVIEHSDEGRWDRALALYGAASELRQEGIEELRLLVPYAPPVFPLRIDEADAYNAKMLDQLGAMLERRASRTEFETLRQRMSEEYRSLIQLQRVSWKRYQKELTERRDEVLRKHYGAKPEQIIRERAYEAGELLARELDARFSPTQAAKFLRVHLLTKLRQAQELGVPQEEVERWTAGLYNGGTHNIKRMRVGLIGFLEETENYMRKVPATKSRLEEVLQLPSAM